MVSEGGCSSLSTYQLIPLPSTNLASISCQQLHDTQNERLRIPPSQADHTVKHKSCVLLLTPNTQMPSPASSMTYKPNPNTQDKQIWTKVLPLPDVPMVGKKQCPSSMTFNNDSTPLLSTATPSPSILWDPDPAVASTASLTDRNQTMSTKLGMMLLDGEDAIICSRNSVLLHGDNLKGWKSLEFEEKLAEVIKRVTGEGEGA